MKSLRTILIILCFFMLFIETELSVSAMETGFSTEGFSDNDKRERMNSENESISKLDSEPTKSVIECFAVRKDGMIALGLDKNIIAVYDADGEFQYGYKFKCYGNFGLEWDENDIIIYYVRGNLAVSVSPEGEVNDILKIQDTMENNWYWNQKVFSERKQVGKRKYILRNNMGFLNFFATAHSQLISIDVDGNGKMIYDVNFKYMMKSMLMFSVVLLVFVSAIIWIVRFVQNFEEPSLKNVNRKTDVEN